MTQMPLETANELFAAANLMAIVGGILVVVGAAGIFFFGSIRENYTDRHLQELRTETAIAQEGAAKSNERSQELQLELEKERTERIKIEQRLAPRRIPQSLRDDLKRTAAPDSDTRIHLSVVANNAEGSDLINELGAALMDAGWPADRLGGSTDFAATYPDGLSILVNPAEANGDNIRGPVAPIISALHLAGLTSSTPLLLDETVPAGTIKIAAGFKPGRNG